jgi:hypothetical protein
MDAEPLRGERGITRNGGRPGDQLALLIGRAENGRAAEPGLSGVGAALMHWCAVQSFRHTNGSPGPRERRTYRHSFLLPDGGVRLVWELEHDTGPGTEIHRVVLTDPVEVAATEWCWDAAFDLRAWLGGPAAGEPCPPVGGLTDEPELRDPRALDSGAPDLGDSGWQPEDYTEDGSRDHAWRLLRRAANADAPGVDVRRRLLTSVGYAIGIVARHSTVVAGRHVSWSLYEHAFLLPDGTQLSLWEIDHTRTPDGGPVCEVYGTREAALDTAVRRIEAG